MAHVLISLKQEDGYPPVSAEELHTREVGENLHEVVSTPIFVPALAVGDIINTVTHDNGEVWGTGVATEGDHWCARVVGLDGYDGERIVEIFESMGAKALLTSFGIVTLNVAPGVDAEHILTELRAGRDEGDWDFDIGVKPPGLD